MGWFGLMFLVMVMIFGCGGGGVGPGNEFDNLFANWWVDTAGNIVNWYSDCGHLEKSVIKNKLLEVRHDSKAKEPYEAI